MLLRCATFNVLADAYIGYGNYHHVTPELLLPGARIPHLVQLIANLPVDVICLQEVELGLAHALSATGEWRQFWSQKKGGDLDGCLILVRPGINATGFSEQAYRDGSGYIMQSVIIEGVRIANTHIIYPPQTGIAQVKELIEWLGTGPTVIFADGNDRPNGPVRALLEDAGYRNILGNIPTALIGSEHASLDLIAVHKLHAAHISTTFTTDNIPNEGCPSDHIPMLAVIEV